MRRLHAAVLATLTVLCFSAPPPATATNRGDQIEFLLAPGFRMVGYDVVYNPDKNLNFLTDFPAVNADGTANQIVEIPAGDLRKFETSPETGKMFWELKNGVPRIVKFVGYPFNYGAVPGTSGGDGDPLDILTIGRMELRASVVPARVIGVLCLDDGGDVDDKLVAVLPGTHFDGVESIADLDAKFPNASAIIEIWLTSYKGPGEITVRGCQGEGTSHWGGPELAGQILEEGIAAF